MVCLVQASLGHFRHAARQEPTSRGSGEGNIRQQLDSKMPNPLSIWKWKYLVLHSLTGAFFFMDIWPLWTKPFSTLLGAYGAQKKKSYLIIMYRYCLSVSTWLWSIDSINQTSNNIDPSNHTGVIPPPTPAQLHSEHNRFNHVSTFMTFQRFEIWNCQELIEIDLKSRNSKTKGWCWVK